MFTALDVETATGSEESICQIGLALVKGRKVTKSCSWLVRPPGNEYWRKNIEIHGITPRMTGEAPGFGELWPELAPYFTGKLLAAHFAAFDMPVLLATAWMAGVNIGAAGVLDSCIAARRAFPELPNHKLPTVCEYLNIPLTHHDAGADALASARILIEAGPGPLMTMEEVCDTKQYYRYFWAAGR